ncbi:hypothetical protein D3C85_1451760 [compost metagenome]
MRTMDLHTVEANSFRIRSSLSIRSDDLSNLLFCHGVNHFLPKNVDPRGSDRKSLRIR